MPDIPKYARLEIERRWLADLGAVGALEGRPYREVHDLYIAGTRLRLRKISGPAGEAAFKLGKKYGKRGAFFEPVTNLYLSEREYQALSSLPGARIHKRRYALSGGSLDVYLGPLDGLAIFEIELGDEGSAQAYQPPGFVLREITHDADFTGAALASRGAAPPSGDGGVR
ncbi:MAG TPA: hypothetical protein VFO94_09275 [Gammaproteobacteria bacterium]|nr:hypothetical protein [Gammaproteobacteria bacterium]